MTFGSILGGSTPKRPYSATNPKSTGSNDRRSLGDWGRYMESRMSGTLHMAVATRPTGQFLHLSTYRALRLRYVYTR